MSKTGILISIIQEVSHTWYIHSKDHNKDHNSRKPQGGQPSQAMPPGSAASPSAADTPFNSFRKEPELLPSTPAGIRMWQIGYTYIWLRNRQAFWFYPDSIGRESIAGFRWIGYRWV